MAERDLHRRLAVELNNETWDGLEQLDGGADPDRLLYGAYAAAYHWMLAGTAIHRARAEHLLSRVATAIGRHELGLAHARSCAEILATEPDGITAADPAFAAEALARALAATGSPEAAAALDHARRLTAGIEDAEDREIVEAELARGPWFGLT
jgi:hypothetical protein